jgi:hypothetical protein
VQFVPAVALTPTNGSEAVADKSRRYRILAVSLPAKEAAEADRLAEILKRAGWPRASRSLVVREALLRLSEDVAGKESEDIFRYFLDRYAKRAAGAVSSKASS